MKAYVRFKRADGSIDWDAYGESLAAKRARRKAWYARNEVRIMLALAVLAGAWGWFTHEPRVAADCAPFHFSPLTDCSEE